MKKRGIRNSSSERSMGAIRGIPNGKKENEVVRNDDISAMIMRNQVSTS